MNNGNAFECPKRMKCEHETCINPNRWLILLSCHLAILHLPAAVAIICIAAAAAAANIITIMYIIVTAINIIVYFICLALMRLCDFVHIDRPSARICCEFA